MPHDTPSPVLIVNPHAGRARRLMPACRALLPAAAVIETPDLDALDRVAGRLGGAGVVACLGGDGSLHHLVNALWRRGDGEMPMLLPLAGGTLNGLALALGGRHPAADLRAVLAAQARGPLPCRSLRPLLVEDRDGAPPRLGFTLAAGLPARAVARYRACARPGTRDVIAICLHAVASGLAGGRFMTPEALTVVLDGAEAAAPHSLVAGVIARPFLWVRPFGPAPAPAGRFRCLTLSIPPRQVALRLWPILRGRCRHPGLHHLRPGLVAVAGEGGYALDGEMPAGTGAFALRLRLGPALRLVDVATLRHG